MRTSALAMASRMFCGALLGAPCILSKACFRSATPQTKVIVFFLLLGCQMPTMVQDMRPAPTCPAAFAYYIIQLCNERL